jgi:hypothetical protein
MAAQSRVACGSAETRRTVMTDEMQRAECRALSEAELDSVSGATSAVIYAVVHEIRKAVWDGGYYIDKTVDPPVVRPPQNS